MFNLFGSMLSPLERGLYAAGGFGFGKIYLRSMKIIKNGGHRLFESDEETARIVSGMLKELERDGMDAVRRFSEKFDGWSPASFELDAAQIGAAVIFAPRWIFALPDIAGIECRHAAQRPGESAFLRHGRGSQQDKDKRGPLKHETPGTAAL